MIPDVSPPEEEIRTLRHENENFRLEIDRLELELKKISREFRTSNSFLDKVTKVSEAKETLNNALSVANAKQRAYTDMLLESCHNIIILFDNDGRFILSTKIFLITTKTPNFDYIKNRSYEEVFPKYFSSEDMNTFKTTFGKVISNNDFVGFDAWVDFSQDGNKRFYSIELRRAGSGSESVSDISQGVLVVMVDITDIMYEKQRAEAASHAKSDFLAAMSHEIRTPMNAIIGMSEMLGRSKLNTQQKKYVSDIRKASTSLLTIINDILDFSKIEAGKMELVNSNYHLKMLLENLYSMFKVLCFEKNLSISFKKAENLPEMAYGDETRLRQILTNLLSNAAKYTKEGGLIFSAWLEEDNLCFSVKDSGIGIRENDMEKLFKPFEQLDTRKNRSIVGTGLGLAISYNLCKMMGGDLTLESVYGEGSTFLVTLPFAKADKTITEETDDISDFAAPNAKILIVDDIEINLEVAEAMLGAFKIFPTLAITGLKAIELAKINQYDIIFMDHMMPEMDGLETTKHIRELGGWNSKVPIIALTANAIDGMGEIFLENQMDDFLFKPIDINSLNLCLQKWLPSKMILKEDSNND